MMNTNSAIVLSDSERQPCEIWSRVMGYHRPISEWNHGKKQEFAERRQFIERHDCCDQPMQVAAE